MTTNTLWKIMAAASVCAVGISGVVVVGGEDSCVTMTVGHVFRWISVIGAFIFLGYMIGKTDHEK